MNCTILVGYDPPWFSRRTAYMCDVKYETKKEEYCGHYTTCNNGSLDLKCNWSNGEEILDLHRRRFYSKCYSVSIILVSYLDETNLATISKNFVSHWWGHYWQFEGRITLSRKLVKVQSNNSFSKHNNIWHFTKPQIDFIHSRFTILLTYTCDKIGIKSL